MVLEEQRRGPRLQAGRRPRRTEYVLAGGGFPFTVNGVGVVGGIGVPACRRGRTMRSSWPRCATISASMKRRSPWGMRLMAALQSLDFGRRAGSHDRESKAFLTSIFEAAVAPRSRRTIRNASACKAEGPDHRRRCRQGLGADGGRLSKKPGTGRSKGSSSRATAMRRLRAHRGARSRASGARCGRPGGGEAAGGNGVRADR